MLAFLSALIMATSIQQDVPSSLSQNSVDEANVAAALCAADSLFIQDEIVTGFNYATGTLVITDDAFNNATEIKDIENFIWRAGVDQFDLVMTRGNTFTVLDPRTRNIRAQFNAESSLEYSNIEILTWALSEGQVTLNLPIETSISVYSADEDVRLMVSDPDALSSQTEYAAYRLDGDHFMSLGRFTLGGDRHYWLKGMDDWMVFDYPPLQKDTIYRTHYSSFENRAFVQDNQLEYREGYRNFWLGPVWEDNQVQYLLSKGYVGDANAPGIYLVKAQSTHLIPGTDSVSFSNVITDTHFTFRGILTNALENNVHLRGEAGLSALQFDGVVLNMAFEHGGARFVAQINDKDGQAVVIGHIDAGHIALDRRLLCAPVQVPHSLQIRPELPGATQSYYVPAEDNPTHSVALFLHDDEQGAFGPVLSEVAQGYVDQGISVALLNTRGSHGFGAEAYFGPGRRFWTVRDQVDDIDAMVDLLKTTYGYENIILVGLGYGGYLASNYLWRHRDEDERYCTIVIKPLDRIFGRASQISSADLNVGSKPPVLYRADGSSRLHDIGVYLTRMGISMNYPASSVYFLDLYSDYVSLISGEDASQWHDKRARYPFIRPLEEESGRVDNQAAWLSQAISNCASGQHGWDY